MTEATISRESHTSSPTFRPELAFPRLTDDMLDRLRGYGIEEHFPKDTALFSRGQRDVDMFVVIQGTIEVYVREEHDTRTAVATLREMQFTGELDLLSSRRTLVDGCTATGCTLLRIERTELQRLMRTEGDIANLIMQATIWRRLGIIEQGFAGVLLVGDARGAETIQLQRFLVRNGYPYHMIDPQLQTEAHALPGADGVGITGFPAVVLMDGRVLQKPTIARLADELGITEAIDETVLHDVVVVGAGPSGLAAAVYAASEGLKTMVIDGTAPGGQAGTSSKIENYLGFPTGISGQELANRAQVQAQKFGARLAISRDVVSLTCNDGVHTVALEDGGRVRSRSVIVATGARYRKLDIENYARFEYQGIHYAATAMEASLAQNQEVAVIGGGNSAGQAAIFLSASASHVHLLIRGASLESSMSDYLIQRIAHSSKITLHSDSEVERLEGDAVLERVAWRHRSTGELEVYPVRNMFVMIGAAPNTEWLRGSLALDAKGFVLTGVDASAPQYSRYATSCEGVYAVGDVRSDSVKRVASAVGEGSVVISDVHRYLQAYRAS